MNTEWAKLYATIACLRSPPIGEEFENPVNVVAFLAAAISDQHFQSLTRDERWETLERIVKSAWHPILWAIRPLLHRLPAISSQLAIQEYEIVEGELIKYLKQLKSGQEPEEPETVWQRVVLQATRNCASYGEQVVGLRHKLVNQEWDI